MNLFSADNSCKNGTIIGLLESGIPEQAFVKKSHRHSLFLIPTPPPCRCFSYSHLSALYPRSERLKQANLLVDKESLKKKKDEHLESL